MKVTRGELLDVVVADGRAAVFVHDHVVVLSEIATVILDAVSRGEWVSLTELTASLIATMGEPEAPLDARSIVEHNVLDLLQHGVLVR